MPTYKTKTWLMIDSGKFTLAELDWLTINGFDPHFEHSMLRHRSKLTIKDAPIITITSHTEEEEVLLLLKFGNILKTANVFERIN